MVRFDTNSPNSVADA